ncbi:MAG: hypothetical protein ACYST2_06145 [Planctomycetota bacterium]|jgi:hypothetical protein
MKWEYLIIKPHKNLEQREFAFNSLGNEEWELVTATESTAYFKRLADNVSNTLTDYESLSKDVEAIEGYFGGKVG